MRPAHRTLVVATLLLGLATAAGPSRGAEVSIPASRLEEVNVAHEGDSVIVRLKTSGTRRYHADLIDHPYRLVIDLDNTTYAWQRTPIVTSAGPLLAVRGGQYRKGVARVVLELKSPIPYWIHEEQDALVVVLGAPRRLGTRPTSAPPTLAAAVAQTSPVDPAPERAPRAPAAVAQAAPTPPPTVPATPAQPPVPVAPPAAVPPSAPPAMVTAPSAGERLISLEFKDADVVNLLRILAAESGRNIVMGDDVKGKMSISLRNVPWSLALQTVLETRGLQRIDRDGVIRIVSTEQLLKEREARAKEEDAKTKAEEAKAKGQIEIRTKVAEAELKEQEVQQRKLAAEAAVAEAIARGPLTEVAMRLAYADPGEVANTLQSLLGLGQTGVVIPPCRKVTQELGKREVKLGAGAGVIEATPLRGPIAEPPFSQLFGPPREEGRAAAPPPPPEEVTSKRRAVQAHCATNTLFLRLHAADLERVRKLIRESLDVPVPQVKIEARLEVLDRNDLFAIGVQWGGGGVLAVDNKNVIVGRGFTSDFINNPVAGGIPASGLGTLSNPNLLIGSSGGTVIPVSAQNGLPLGGNLINLPISALLNNAATSGGAGGIMFGIIGSKLNLNLTLEALRTQGKTFSLARPDVVTLENNLARISLGEEIPYATVSSAGTSIQFKQALLQLSVIPTVVQEPHRTRIHMSLMVENNSRGTPVNLGGSGAPPAINRRSAETDVIITEGEHLVIGGITTSLQEEEVRKVPILGDIPMLGWLFKQRGTRDTRRELVVFITPSVIRGDARPGPPSPATLPVRPQPPAK